MNACRRIFALALAAVLAFFSAFSAYAVELDGFVMPEDSVGSNIQLQCDRGDSGCGIYVLVTYYKPLDAANTIYLAASAELDCVELTNTDVFCIEVYMDGKDTMKFYANGESEFDRQAFAVDSKVNTAYSGLQFEAVISTKYTMAKNPDISIRVTDNDGMPSKMFRIDTVMPVTEAETQQATEKPTKRQSGSKSSNSKGSSKDNKNKGSSSSKKDKSTTLPYELGGASQVDLSDEQNTSGAFEKRKIAIIAAAVILTTAVTAGVIVVSGRKKEF